MMVSSVNRRVSALLQQSCSILTEELLFPGSGYMLSTAQDIQNVVYVASNCQNQLATAELSHMLHLFFLELEYHCCRPVKLIVKLLKH